MERKENLKETNHGIPDEILDGIFSEEDKGQEKICFKCGCMKNEENKEEEKEHGKQLESQPKR